MHAKSYGALKPTAFAIQLPFLVTLCGDLTVSVVGVNHLGFKFIQIELIAITDITDVAYQ